VVAGGVGASPYALLSPDCRSQAEVRAEFQLFLYLQLLDLLTTLVGLRAGLRELSPFVQHLMRLDPTVGLLTAKLLAVALGGYCLWTQRHRIIGWINYWYAALVTWNLCIILVGWQRT
jgi:hypothetical protein